MIVYRITKAKYKDDLSGIGAKLYGSRWNSIGIPMLYTGEHISLVVLEALVHLQKNEIPINYWLVKIKIPDELLTSIIQLSTLKKKWEQDVAYTQFIGTQFSLNNQSLILKVPSVIINEENNYLLNPLHKDFKKIKITHSNEIDFDNRLLRI